ncbi:MAG: tyrosine-type recombinase/integrase, partial [Thermodesulfobacteriota bacterium]|nr:tyrosine-type recombinase/integrase [Thermodesulfobacteriota bacterium]
MLARRRAKSNGSQLIFPSRSGHPYDRHRITKQFRALANALGLNNGITDKRQLVVFNSVRHTFASWLAQSGTDIYSLMNLMGHSSLAMTKRYAHLIPAQLQESLNRIVL